MFKKKFCRYSCNKKFILTVRSSKNVPCFFNKQTRFEFVYELKSKSVPIYLYVGIEPSTYFENFSTKYTGLLTVRNILNWNKTRPDPTFAYRAAFNGPRTTPVYRIGRAARELRLFR